MLNLRVVVIYIEQFLRNAKLDDTFCETVAHYNTIPVITDGLIELQQFVH